MSFYKELRVGCCTGTLGKLALKLCICLEYRNCFNVCLFFSSKALNDEATPPLFI